MSTPPSFSTRRISARAFSGCGTMCSALDTITTSKDLSAYGRRNISCTEKCSFAERLSRLASTIISAEASVASMCAAAFTMFFAISPVPVASSSTVFAFTTVRMCAHISSYAARSFRIKRSYRPAFLSQKFFCSFIAVALISSLFICRLAPLARPHIAAKFSRAGICPAALWRLPAGRHTPGKVSHPCPMHAPAISAHHEGNGFDLLFLVQALCSFLLCISVSHL